MTIKTKHTYALIAIYMLAFFTLIGSTILMWNTNYGDIPTGYIGIPLSAFLLYAVYLLVKRKHLTKLFLITTISLSVAACVGLLIFLRGFFEDNGGVQCTGFFGAQAECRDIAQLRVFLLFYNPVTAFCTVGLSIIAIVGQIMNSRRISSR